MSEAQKSNRWIWILILVLIIILVPVGIWFYKNSEIKKADEAHEQEKLEMQEQFDAVFLQEQRAHIQLMVKPLTWAVRAEMLRDNLEQVNQYLTQFVKEKNVEQVMLVDDTGQVLISTDKKIEATPFADHYDKAMLSGNDVVLSDREQGQISITAPVMGLNTRLGTLVVFYRPSKYAEKE